MDEGNRVIQYWLQNGLTNKNFLVQFAFFVQVFCSAAIRIDKIPFPFKPAIFFFYYFAIAYWVSFTLITIILSILYFKKGRRKLSFCVFLFPVYITTLVLPPYIFRGSFDLAIPFIPLAGILFLFTLLIPCLLIYRYPDPEFETVIFGQTSNVGIGPIIFLVIATMLFFRLFFKTLRPFWVDLKYKMELITEEERYFEKWYPEKTK